MYLILILFPFPLAILPLILHTSSSYFHVLIKKYNLIKKLLESHWCYLNALMNGHEAINLSIDNLPMAICS